MEYDNLLRMCPKCDGQMIYICSGWLEVEEQEADEYECHCCGFTEYDLK